MLFLPAVQNMCAYEVSQFIFWCRAEWFSHLLFGGYITNIVLRGEMGLDDSKAGTTHSFAHSFGKVAEPCSTPTAHTISLLTEACEIHLLLSHSIAALEMIIITATLINDSDSNY